MSLSAAACPLFRRIVRPAITTGRIFSRRFASISPNGARNEAINTGLVGESSIFRALKWSDQQQLQHNVAPKWQVKVIPHQSSADIFFGPTHDIGIGVQVKVRTPKASGTVVFEDLNGYAGQAIVLIRKETDKWERKVWVISETDLRTRLTSSGSCLIPADDTAFDRKYLCSLTPETASIQHFATSQADTSRRAPHILSHLTKLYPTLKQQPFDAWKVERRSADIKKSTMEIEFLSTLRIQPLFAAAESLGRGLSVDPESSHYEPWDEVWQRSGQDKVYTQCKTARWKKRKEGQRRAFGAQTDTKRTGFSMYQYTLNGTHWQSDGGDKTMHQRRYKLHEFDVLTVASPAGPHPEKLVEARHGGAFRLPTHVHLLDNYTLFYRNVLEGELFNHRSNGKVVLTLNYPHTQRFSGPNTNREKGDRWKNRWLLSVEDSQLQESAVKLHRFLDECAWIRDLMKKGQGPQGGWDEFVRMQQAIDRGEL
eukprot:GDKI01030741.1.p1 GENE.GDKI01030741.1~~GDKI01030741.1.p1  ORF type:complete len:482 (+),score=28.37 GDKI01030741.1:92-1537(+)